MKRNSHQFSWKKRNIIGRSRSDFDSSQSGGFHINTDRAFENHNHYSWNKNIKAKKKKYEKKKVFKRKKEKRGLKEKKKKYKNYKN